MDVSPRRLIPSPGVRRWALRVVAVLAVIIAALALPLGCTTHITPPTLAVDEPRTSVYVLNHGYTSSLLLPSPQGGVDRWVYGEYRWYALGQTGFLRAFPTLFWPTRGGLGRQHYPSPARVEDVGLAERAQTRHHLIVSAARADAVGRALQQTSADADPGSEVWRADEQMVFTYYPRNYTYFHNSNHKVAAWLRDLGCRTRGPSFRSSWRVRQPGGGT